MIKTIKTVFVALCLLSQLSISQDILSPKDFLGYELGSKFTPHHKVIEYFKSVESANSSQVKLTKYGTTNEGRDLYLAFISSEENIKNLVTIRKNHLANAGLENGDNQSAEAAIVWLSYNVHGNEASATEAAINTFYKLLNEKSEWLKNTVVIIDPCLNPDGHDRYVNWITQVARAPYDTDPQAREHLGEPWPGGRPNHYYFDLNRDWLWATQIESKTRLEQYNKWMPHIHADFHEQGYNDKYYFAPAAKPFHEIITPWQRDFQTEIGKNHAKYFDKDGLLFFTRERFDLFYPSYGDTYPTYMGAIGMTYEQAGHGRGGLGILTKDKEILTLKERLNNHTITGLSTVEMASKNAVKLNQEFKTYFKNDNQNIKSYVLSGDKEKIDALTALLDQHQISYEHTSNGSVSRYNYKKGTLSKMKINDEGIVVHTNQPKGKMVKTMFEPNAKLEDSLTYDITAWSLPYAYGIDAVASKVKVNGESKNENSVKPKTLSKAFGYVCEWNSMLDAKYLSALLQNGFKVRVAQKPFTSNGKRFKAGALVILERDHFKMNNFITELSKITQKFDQDLNVIKSGFSETTPDIGSHDMALIHLPKVAAFAGSGVSSLSYGEVWHFFEQELKYPLTTLNLEDYSSLNLNKYDVIILPSGRYNSFVKADELKKLKAWVRRGGRLICIDNALSTFASDKSFKLNRKKPNEEAKKKEQEKNKLIPYNKRERAYISNLITGAIFNTEIDNTHPLAFGYDKQYFTLKLGASSYSLLDSGYNVSYLKSNKVYSGFAGHNALKNIENTLVFGEERMGKGSAIYFTDNVLFRAFWENGKLFMANAVFFVNNDGDTGY